VWGAGEGERPCLLPVGHVFPGRPPALFPSGVVAPRKTGVQCKNVCGAVPCHLLSVRSNGAEKAQTTKGGTCRARSRSVGGSRACPRSAIPHPLESSCSIAARPAGGGRKSRVRGRQQAGRAAPGQRGHEGVAGVCAVKIVQAQVYAHKPSPYRPPGARPHFPVVASGGIRWWGAGEVCA